MSSAAPHADPDAELLLAAVLRESNRQADQVAAFLESVGLAPAPGETQALPADLLFKVGALLRLYRWDRSGVLPHLGHDFPSWDEVYADLAAGLRGEASRFSGEDLDRRVLRAYLDRIAWTPWEGRIAEVAVVARGGTDELLDRLARLLWDHRHLARRTPAPRTDTPTPHTNTPAADAPTADAPTPRTKGRT